MLVNIAKDLKLFYVNQLDPKRHTCDDPVHGTSDILDMTSCPQVQVPKTFLSALLMITWAVITSPSKFHLTSHSNRTHHLTNHVTDLTKQTMTYYSLFHGFWQSFVTIGSCNHLMRIISTYVGNTKKSEIS